MRSQFPSLDIEVDGGVGPDTIDKCAEVRKNGSGVNHFIVPTRCGDSFHRRRPSSGWSQHDRVRQRCDRERRPPLRHRPPSHSRGRRHPETLAGPLRPPLTPQRHDTAVNQNGHFSGAEGSKALATGRGRSLECHHVSESEAAHCPASPQQNSCRTSCSERTVAHHRRSRADSTSVNIPER